MASAQSFWRDSPLPPPWWWFGTKSHARVAASVWPWHTWNSRRMVEMLVSLARLVRTSSCGRDGQHRGMVTGHGSLHVLLSSGHKDS